eukprot:gene16131-18234_t
MTVGTVTDAITNGANTKAAAGDRFRCIIAAQLAGTKIAASATIGGAGKFVRSGSAADLNGRPNETMAASTRLRRPYVVVDTFLRAIFSVRAFAGPCLNRKRCASESNCRRDLALDLLLTKIEIHGRLSI